ncbi:MAG: hypothetical protein AB8B78_05315 [Polaribacter sp.]
MFLLKSKFFSLLFLADRNDNPMKSSIPVKSLISLPSTFKAPVNTEILEVSILLPIKPVKPKSIRAFLKLSSGIVVYCTEQSVL